MSDLVSLYPQAGRYGGLAATADLNSPAASGRPALYVSLDGGPVFYDDPDTGRTEVWAGLSLTGADVRDLLARADALV
jgi:hypothetical protein